MNDAIVVALIGGLCTAIPTVVCTWFSNNKNQAVINAKVDANNQFLSHEIKELKSQVEKHNSIIERTYHLEEQVHLINQKVDLYHKE
ncbi:MAG: hypothetical protein PUF50_02340 [Erysipelotrichaceae bacterium]|nr:hypothetical protein [Erysipelotrichaceae bacterium]